MTFRCAYGRMLYLPGIDIGKPTTLILAAIDIKRDSNGFARLYVCLCNAVGAKDLKANLLGVLFLCLQHIFLLFPLVSCFADTAYFRKYSNYFSGNFHIFIINDSFFVGAKIRFFCGTMLICAKRNKISTG